jgi:hypothetical protein
MLNRILVYGGAACVFGMAQSFLPTIGSAHDRWGDGGEVPAWVKQTCCGENDVHWYTPDSVKVTEAGYVLPNYPDVIPKERGVPSPSNDGLYWVFFARRNDGGAPPVYCFYFPPLGA